MLQEFGSEDVVSLAVSLSLLGSFVCFLKILIDANLRAWRERGREDKDLAVTAGRDKKRQGGGGGGGGKVTRISEQELLGNASLVPRPFLRTREEFEIRGRRKARERVWQI